MGLEENQNQNRTLPLLCRNPQGPGTSESLEWLWVIGARAGWLPTWAFVLHEALQGLAGWHGLCSLLWAGPGCQRQALPTGLCVFPAGFWSSICLGAEVTSGCSSQLSAWVFFLGASWSYPWGRMGVGGGQRLLGFFSWWVVGLEQSRAPQPSLPQPPCSPVRFEDIRPTADLGQCDDCWFLCQATAYHSSPILSLSCLHPLALWTRLIPEPFWACFLIHKSLAALSVRVDWRLNAVMWGRCCQ